MKNNLSGAIFVIARYASSFLVLLISCLSSAQAQQPLFYSCEVNNLYILAEDGALRGMPKSNLKGLAKGQRFQINILSGAMIGEMFSSRSWASTVVLDNGLSPIGSAYKAIYSSPPGGEFINLAFFQVDYSKNVEGNKPFVFVDADDVFTGTCRYAS